MRSGSSEEPTSDRHPTVTQQSRSDASQPFYAEPRASLGFTLLNSRNGI